MGQFFSSSFVPLPQDLLLIMPETAASISRRARLKKSSRQSLNLFLTPNKQGYRR